MCCFTGPVISVSTTKIFARAGEKEQQFLVYSMQVEADKELAMVLPLPVKQDTGEDGITFINLKDYPEFFEDMEKGFPRPVTRSRSDHGLHPTPLSGARLAVVEVGDFEASFVPTVKDFTRLDSRFRLPQGAWKKLPSYLNYGFAVFKLKPGLQQVHPMAFSFPRRDVHSLFFPTVHIHDGHVHEKAEFDHILYCQPTEGKWLDYDSTIEWRESPSHARSFIKLPKAQGLIESDQHCYRHELHGDLPNHDTFVGLET